MFHDVSCLAIQLEWVRRGCGHSVSKKGVSAAALASDRERYIAYGVRVCDWKACFASKLASARSHNRETHLRSVGC